MDKLLVFGLVIFLVLSLYVIHVNISLSSIPEEVQKISPERYDPETIRKTYDRLLKEPITVKLPPKTGRRYIVVGGAGFLPSNVTPIHPVLSSLVGRLDRSPTSEAW